VNAERVPGSEKKDQRSQLEKDEAGGLDGAGGGLAQAWWESGEVGLGRVGRR
jgi:hypothetical protein